jgi:hypothetical protein
VPLSMCRRKASADDVLQRHGIPSQAEPTSTPEAIWDQQSSGGPSEKYQCTGAPLKVLPDDTTLRPLPLIAKRPEVHNKVCLATQNGSHLG